jgi:hypothetical protein
MRVLLILLLLLANLMLFGANHQMFGPIPYAGLRNPAPLARELNPSGMQVRPMAPGEYVDHPVVGPADPTAKVQEQALPVAAGAAASGAEANAASSGSSATSDIAASNPAPASAPTASPASAASDSSVHHAHKKHPVHHHATS